MSLERPDFDCSIHLQASFGGVEARRFAGMLLRVYTRWAERVGLGHEIGEIVGGEDGEVERATLKLAGDGLPARLRGEAGAHRLVRLPPGETRRHASFVFVKVIAAYDDADAATTSAAEEQARTYILHPSESVTDDRTGARTEDAQAVLDGDLSPFILDAAAQRP